MSKTPSYFLEELVTSFFILKWRVGHPTSYENRTDFKFNNQQITVGCNWNEIAVIPLHFHCNYLQCRLLSLKSPKHLTNALKFWENLHGEETYCVWCRIHYFPTCMSHLSLLIFWNKKMCQKRCFSNFLQVLGEQFRSWV